MIPGSAPLQPHFRGRSATSCPSRPQAASSARPAFGISHLYFCCPLGHRAGHSCDLKCIASHKLILWGLHITARKIVSYGHYKRQMFFAFFCCAFDSLQQRRSVFKYRYCSLVTPEARCSAEVQHWAQEPWAVFSVRTLRIWGCRAVQAVWPQATGPVRVCQLYTSRAAPAGGFQHKQFG